MSPANEPRLSKAEKTAQAREKARAIREEQLKKEKRNKLLVGWGIVVAVVVIIALVAFVVIGNAQNNAPVADQGPTPANGNVHGGITLLANTEVVKSEPASVNVADVPAPLATKPATVTVPGGEAEAGKPVKVVAYIDFICPVCKQFETAYGESLTNLRNEGKISVEYRALGFLDRQSTTNYSSRAANAAACVVNSSPEKYAEFFNLLFERQPAEGGAGISDNDLKKMATEIGAANIDSCIDSKQFRPWVKVATQEAAAIGVTGTPTVFIDGKQWDGRSDLNAEIQTAIGAKG
ncbi:MULTISPECIES: DsbA family protein [Paenarthrobacter]|uniref:DsbA family protein n=1 Tax=Paenarthrobacter TaxID=1742992 RepID=UPI000AD122CD|nr:DsbA family protein [Paenarthrobacter nitroguajacolicus]NWL12604.1 disulfide bond formation protein DsbA [Paenarthrobacter nitroguajacolicus]NWL35588.1 disulfide bond formation protein DsbA [Paenarthrobacter nitroguajacolicus]